MQISLHNFILKKIKKIKKKRIKILVSGGNSLKYLFHNLSKKKFRWNLVDLFLTDERCLSKNSSLLNYKIINKHFIKNEAKNINFYSFTNDPKKIVLKNIRKRYKNNKFDLAILGMGSDGHIASIFPHMKDFYKIINCKERPNVFITENLGRPFCKRITMNLSFILRSKDIILILSNKKKIRFYKDIMHISNKRRRIPIAYLNLLKNKNLILANKKKIIDKNIIVK
jgi:6-phosphogluconolactonase